MSFGAQIQDDAGEIQAILRNGCFDRRPLASVLIAPTWTALRVAARIGIENTDISRLDETGTPRLAIGLCAGELGGLVGVAAPALTHFVGAVTTDATWFVEPAGSKRYVIESFAPAKQVGATLTTGSNSLGTNMIWNPSALKLLFIDITKGSPYTVAVKLFPSGNVTADLTEANFLAQYKQASPTFSNHSNGSAQNLTVNEGTDGVLTHACISWNRGSPPIYVADFGVWKIA